MKKNLRVLGLIFIGMTISQLSGCNSSEQNEKIGEKNPYWDVEIIDGGNPSLDDDLGTNVETNIYGDKTKEEILDEEFDRRFNLSSYDAVLKSIEVDLQMAGFDTGYGYAVSEKEESYCSGGLYYYAPKFRVYDDSNIQSCGFYEVVEDFSNKAYSNPFKKDELVYIDSLDENDDNVYVFDYAYENILPNHFIYKDKYIQYYQQNETRIVYSILDNKKENYDLSYGSLYDFDKNEYIYDESIFDDYTSHSGIESFSNEDYEKLQTTLQEYADQQLDNGYIVEEFKIVYISPESIMAYLRSEEEDTFFGYGVDELTAELGLGNAYEYTSEGFVKATVLEKQEQGYNWKSFLTKIGIGCGIILIGAVLAPITGGASFGCALFTITKVAVSFALTSALSGVVIGAVKGLFEGKSIEETLKGAVFAGLDGFATGFLIGAVIGSVGVVSGLIKPSACFVAGTEVAISTSAVKEIQDIRTGDLVVSYNEETGRQSTQRVTDVFKKQVTTLVDLTINGDCITTTTNHPFYLPDKCQWATASSLHNGQKVLMLNGTLGTVTRKTIRTVEPTDVYNFTVDNNHTYYVGDDGVLVHNECAAEFRNRNGGTKAQAQKIKQEIQDIYNGTSKSLSDYPSDLVRNIQSSKSWREAYNLYKGELAAHHGIPVSVIQRAGLDPSLVSDPNNLISLTNAEHTLIHKLFGRVSVSAEYFKTLIQFRPSLASQIIQLALKVGIIL